jgi:hypothetical protein
MTLKAWLVVFDKLFINTHKIHINDLVINDHGDKGEENEEVNFETRNYLKLINFPTAFT